jgi:tetratricopeptide (TPR) repeat protein
MKKNPTTDRRLESRLLACVAVALLALVVFGGVALAQSKKPITRDGLVNAVRINGLSTAELVQQIQSRGVGFQMSADAEQQLRQAGARPEVIEAARRNYRAGGATPAVSTGAKGNKSNVPSGAPLSKSEIVTMLQAGTPSARVEQFVDARGVSFQSNSQTAQEIKRAGGTNSLIGAISSAYVASGAGRASPGRNTGVVGGRRLDYDELTDGATAAFYARDSARATQLLQQAIQLDSSQPRAYQLLGFTQLYLQGNINEAERNMRRAIELGGSAAFRAYHDHANGSFRDTCAGTLFVTKTNVTFKADDGAHTFEAYDTDIKEIKTNKLVGSALGVFIGGAGDIGAFHIKVKRGGDTKNYNFAPLTKKSEEAKLIVSLAQSYGGIKN